MIDPGLEGVVCAACPIYACQYLLFEERVWILYGGTMWQSSIKQATPLAALSWCEKKPTVSVSWQSQHSFRMF